MYEIFLIYCLQCPKHFDYLYIYTYTCVRHVSCIIESLVISRASLSMRPGYAEVPVSG